MFEQRFGVSGHLKPSFANSHYTQIASAVIDDACSMVEIYCNDLSCIAYPEIEYSMAAARKQGPPVLIYARKADANMIERLKQLDVQLCVKDHELGENDYIITDRRIILSSNRSNDFRIGSWEINRTHADFLGKQFALTYEDVNPILRIHGRKELCNHSTRFSEEVPQNMILERRRAYEEMLRRIAADGRTDVNLTFDRALHNLDS